MLLLKVSLFLCFVLNVIATSSVSTSKNCVVILAKKSLGGADITNLKTFLTSLSSIQIKIFKSSFVRDVFFGSINNIFTKKHASSDYQAIGYYNVFVDEETLIEELSKYEGMGNFGIRGYDSKCGFYEHFFDSKYLLK